MLLVEVRQQTSELPELIQRAVRQHVGLTLDDISLLEPGTLPRTSSGKIRRAEAGRLWQANELDAPKSRHRITHRWHLGKERTRASTKPVYTQKGSNHG